ncbi:MAG: hypothetical protein FD119_1250 [Stygiobacter sp.]|nr:MAG: hypothetical protein FD119_1250 [Stygiobacter sp.]
MGNVWDGVRCKMYGYKPTGDFRTDVEEFNKHLRALEAVEELEEVLPPEDVKTYTAEEVDQGVPGVFRRQGGIEGQAGQSKHDSAGMLTESCSVRKDAMDETFYQNVDYPDQR